MIDTHTHSHHSPDGQASLMAMVEAAKARGLTGITFTEHAEWYPGDDAYGYLDLDTYFAELDKTRARFAGSMAVLAGIELGNPHEFPDQVHAMLTDYPFDLAVGSVHWLDGFPGWEPPIFEQGIAATYQRYFDEVALMVTQADFDVLGHLDLVRRDSWELFHQTLPLDRHMESIDTILAHLIATDRGLEVNTSGLRKGLPEPIPGLEVLRRYRALGGKILVFGSDGHRPEDIAYGFDTARDLALAAGFERLAKFEQRQIIGWTNL